MKKKVIICSLIIGFFVIVLGLAVYRIYSNAISFVDKCDGYRSVKFGMNVTEAMSMARKDGIFIKNIDDNIQDRLHYWNSPYFCGIDNMSGQELEIVYYYTPKTLQVYDVMVFYHWSDQEYYQNLTKEMEKKYGNFYLPTVDSEGDPMTSWWGFKRIIYLLKGFDPFGYKISVLYRDKKLFNLYEKEQIQQEKEREKKRLEIDSDKL